MSDYRESDRQRRNELEDRNQQIEIGSDVNPVLVIIVEGIVSFVISRHEIKSLLSGKNDVY